MILHAKISAGRQYAEVLARSLRDTKWNLMSAMRSGYSHEEFRHWVDTGQGPDWANRQVPTVVIE